MTNGVTLRLPPGFTARESASPWQDALAGAASGLAAGTLLHAGIGGVLEAALILSPDRPVTDETVLRLATLAVLDALLAVAPPERAVAVTSPGCITVNAGDVTTMQLARGSISAVAPEEGDAAEWIVVAITLRLALALAAPGLTPWLTDLAEEGFDVDGVALLESICRYLLSMIELWQSDGEAAIARAWQAAPGVEAA